ncbi:ABC transporter permease [Aestuariicella sp. G3-2]|uniref:ABC transporter permease n=1 Tax=Pseudomaricurvus albidus TaxID=2842452 RepID=UPI001C0CCE16|nr:ABC transporter permease [Aestuariicella albida]MBU3071655.1 ABC transporter permease [Aestuariicella albida]
MLVLLRSLWSYRGFVVSSIRNEFKARFTRSKLGGLWMIINPLAQVLIYALVLSNVLAAKLPGIDNQYAYALYLMAGILAWSLFFEVITRCLTLFIEQGNLMKKMAFPRITLPAIVSGSCLLNHSLLFVAILGVFTVLGHPPTWLALWLLPLMVILLALSLSIGMMLGIVNVFVRDVGQVVPIVLQTLFWFTPIVYPVSILPENLQSLICYNPIYPLINAYQNILVFNQSPSTESLLITTGLAFLFIIFSLFVFRRASPEMVDVL